VPDVELTRAGAVATITLNRPDRLNALTEDLHAALAAALAEAACDGPVVVIVGDVAAQASLPRALSLDLIARTAGGQR